MTRNATLTQAPRRSLVDSAIEQIRTQIESGVWRVGERIPKEQELADLLGVSRNTTREAIRVLSHAEVLEVRQGDGTYVRLNVDPTEVMRRVSRSSLHDHFELRAMLEAEAARRAASQRSDADVVKLRRLLKVLGNQEDHSRVEKFVDADIAFHSALASVSGNTALIELYRYFSQAIRSGVWSVLDELDLPEPALEAHEAIVDAIERRDPEGAALAVREVVGPLIEALADRS